MGDSPFKRKKVEFKREPSTYESIRDFVRDKTNQLFLAYLPSDDIKAMSPEYLYPIGCIALLSLIGIFLAVFMSGLAASARTQYLSPSTGTTASRLCDTVPTINTGSYLATQSGVWEGAEGFQYGEAAYQLSVTSLSLTYDSYKSVMDDAYLSLESVNVWATTYDLAQNLIYWMSGVFIPFEDNPAQRFGFTGTPLVVFDRQKITGGMGNVMGSCNATSVSTFDASTGKLTIVYNYAEYVASKQCMDVVNPASLGYYAATDKNKFSIRFDVRTLITAAAVNMGALSFDELVEIPAYTDTFLFGGEIYNVSSYYDPKYKGMDPVNCIQLPGYGLPNGYTQCTMLIERTIYGLPIFNHMGESYTNPVPCNCSNANETLLSNPAYQYNIFSFISGMVFYPVAYDPTSILRLIMQIGLIPVVVAGQFTLFSRINQDAFDAMYIDSLWGQNSPNRTLFESAAYRGDAYSFCNLSADSLGGAASCSVVSFTLFDAVPTSWAISQDYYQLQNGACSANFGPSKEIWCVIIVIPWYDVYYVNNLLVILFHRNKLIESPFAPLTQDYQKCHYDTSTVVFNQAGSSVGNVSLLAPLCIAFILLCVSLAQMWGFVSIKKTYTEFEKSEALSDLALKLLLQRDREQTLGDVESTSSDNKRTVLSQLVAELGEDPQCLYRQESNSEGHPVTWGSVKTAVGLNKRTARDANKRADSTSSHSSTSTAQSAQTAEDTRSKGDTGKGKAGAVRESAAGVELQPIASPLHASGVDVNFSIGNMRAGRSPYVVLNDYEVTSALQKLCNHGPTTTFSVSALLELLDALIDAFEAAATDKSRSVWTQVSQTAVLRIVPVSALSRADRRMLYFKVYTCLSLHAAVMLHMSVEDIKSKQASSVAYTVGKEVLTLAAIHAKL